MGERAFELTGFGELGGLFSFLPRFACRLFDLPQPMGGDSPASPLDACRRPS
jgi:hypothetical protein